MTPPAAKPIGRQRGGQKDTPHSAYGAIALLSAFGWCHHDVGALWGLHKHSIYRIVRAWKEDTWQEGRKKPAICTHIGDMRKFQNKFVFEDREEILQYIQSHPGCSTFDVELECHQTRTVVNIRARELIEAGRVERQNGKYFFGSYK